MTIQAPPTEVERLEEDIAEAITRTMTGRDLVSPELVRDIGDAIGVVLASWGIWTTAEGTIVLERPTDPPD